MTRAVESIINEIYYKTKSFLVQVQLNMTAKIKQHLLIKSTINLY